VEPLLKADKMVLVEHNLQNAKFTLAVPDYVAAEGVHTTADLAKHADKFGSRIYGIEPGAPANQNIQRMLTSGEDGLKGWKLIESSEQGMLGEVERAVRDKKWIAFLAWEPHPMNERFPITYLSGAEQYFGPNYGSTTVNTMARVGYAAQCPNADRLFHQLSFTVPMENAIMAAIATQKQDGAVAARNWVKANPDKLAAWLDGVTTFDGKDGLAAVKASLGM
jgi:glycine betaine/proline transport system substrate-binding protein